MYNTISQICPSIYWILITEAAAAALLDEAGPEPAEGDLRYRLLGDGTAAITGCTGGASQVTVPRTVGGADVTAIAAGAFGAEVLEIYQHCVYKGTKTFTRTENVSGESGVDLTEGEASAASTELESPPTTKSNVLPIIIPSVM